MAGLYERDFSFVLSVLKWEGEVGKAWGRSGRNPGV